MIKKVLIGVAVLVAAVAIFGNNDEGDEAPIADEPAAAEAAPAAETTTAKAKTKAKPTKAKPKPPADTGRMSDSEYRLFQQAHAEVIDESLQFSDEAQACGVIGETLDLVGFRSCMDDAYSGFEEDVDYAVYLAEDTLDDVAGKCQAALRSYAKVTTEMRLTVTTAYDVANRLDFDAVGPAFEALIPAAKRYAKFSTNALSACEPR